MAEDVKVRVTVMYSPSAREVFEEAIEVGPETTVLEALMASSLVDRFPELELPGCGIGIWGRLVGPAQPVADGDRLEIYRGLKVDPKVARRERFSKQGARGTGLFAKRRPGAKPGY
ncbi:RnfH family protein [Variovorax sp. VNK109]|uniref:RnfH family protein n=1 Tax=Variovorax sp. VNK109 TaxID=3400919 RepID=UPI003C01A523